MPAAAGNSPGQPGHHGLLAAGATGDEGNAVTSHAPRYVIGKLAPIREDWRNRDFRKSHRSRGLYLTAASYAAGATRKLFETAIGLILPFGARSLWAISQGCPRLRSDRDRQRSTTG
jgi:hypothetical protein